MSSSLSSWSTAPMGAGRLLQDARWGVAGFLPAARGCKILILATGAPLRARSQRPTFLRREDASPVGASAPGATQQHSFGKEWHTPESDACAITTPFHTPAAQLRAKRECRSFSEYHYAGVAAAACPLLPVGTAFSYWTGEGGKGEKMVGEEREEMERGGTARGCTTHTLICAR